MAREAIGLSSTGTGTETEGGVAVANATSRFAILNRSATTVRVNCSAPAGVTYSGDDSAVLDAGAWAEFVVVNSGNIAHSVTVDVATTHGTSAHTGDVVLLYY